MLPLLPNEIILDILELTVKSTTSAALNICLLSSDIGRLIRPILYRKVVIMNGRQDMALAWKLDLAEFLQLHLHALSMDLYLSSGYLPGGLGSAPDKVGEPGGFWRARPFLLTNRVCQLQDPGNTLMAFPHLKRLCIFHADDQSLLPIISVPVTHLHLIRPTARFIDIILSNIPPSHGTSPCHIHSPGGNHAEHCLEFLSGTRINTSSRITQHHIDHCQAQHIQLLTGRGGAVSDLVC